MITNWNIQHLEKEIKLLSKNSDLKRKEKEEHLANYCELHDILLDDSKEFVTKDNANFYAYLFNNFVYFFNNIYSIKELMANKKFFSDKSFGKYLDTLKSITDLCDKYDLDTERYQFPKRKIGNNKMIDIGYEYYDSFENRNIIDIYHKIVKSKDTYFLNKKFNNLEIGGICNYFDHNDKLYIIVNKQTSVNDLFTFIHEMEHAMTFIKFKYDFNEMLAELPSCCSTYYLTDFCLERKYFSKNEMALIKFREMQIYISWLASFYDSYFIYNKKNNLETFVFALKKMIKEEDIFNYYDFNYNEYRFKNMVAQLYAKYIYDNFDKNAGYDEVVKYLLNAKDIDYSILNNIISSNELEIKKLTKHLKSNCNILKK